MKWAHGIDAECHPNCQSAVLLHYFRLLALLLNFMLINMTNTETEHEAPKAGVLLVERKMGLGSAYSSKYFFSVNMISGAARPASTMQLIFLA